MPISALDLAELLQLTQRLVTIVKGLQAEALAEEGRTQPEGEPAPRLQRLR